MPTTAENIIKKCVTEAIRQVAFQIRRPAKPSDADFARRFAEYWDSEEFQDSKAMHNASYEEKREGMGGYLHNRAVNIGKRLKTADGDEMSQAELRALMSTSESKNRKRGGLPL